MSEWLTTGEMIDRLKVGEVAEAVSGMVKGWKVEKLPADENFGERIVWRDVLGVDRNVIQLNENVINAKWRILPKYVSFEEAMKALMNGKTVWLWQGDEKVGYYIDRKSGKLWAIAGDCTAPVEKIYFGEKWTIEE
jgi:hypothetical protein